MSSLLLCFGLLCVLDAWAVSLALSCEGQMFQNKEGSCCDSCREGEYIQKECSTSRATQCRPCDEGTYQNTVNHLSRCRTCDTCSDITVEECTATSNAKCSCSGGSMCSDIHCSRCEKKITCQPGETLESKGNVEFTYSCELCPDDTYSNTHDGICKPLTRCSDHGFIALFPGNSTHNAKCAPQHVPLEHSTKENVKTTLLALVCSAVLLLLLYACVKQTLKLKQANSIAVFAPVVSANTADYPYPEEEIGDKISICYGSNYDVAVHVPG